MDIKFKDYSINNYYIVFDSEDYKSIEDFSEGFCATKHNNGVCGYINVNGRETLLFDYDNVEDFHNGLAMVSKNNLYGFINTNFEEVIPCKYIYATRFLFGYSIVKDNNYTFIIDKENRKVEIIDNEINIENIPRLLYSKKLINKKDYESSLKKDNNDINNNIKKRTIDIGLFAAKAYSYYDCNNNKIIPYDNMENRDFVDDFIIVRVDRTDIRIFNKNGKQLKISSCITIDEDTDIKIFNKIQQFKSKKVSSERIGYVSIFNFNNKEYKITANNILELEELKEEILISIKEKLEDIENTDLNKYKIKR